jgi:hypothetical protein
MSQEHPDPVPPVPPVPDPNPDPRAAGPTCSLSPAAPAATLPSGTTSSLSSAGY